MTHVKICRISSSDAVDAAGPHAVDVRSGVRTGGRLDPAKLTRFVAAVSVAGS